MRVFLLLFISIIFLLACKNRDEQIYLVQDRKSDYSIVVSENADSLTQVAAKELQSYIYKVTQASLVIDNELSENTKGIFVGRELLRDMALESELDAIHSDGFMIRVANENIILSGNDGKTNLYACYAFIEEFLGCRLLSATEEFIPNKETVKIRLFQKIYEPAFSFRRILFPGMYNEKYRYWHRIEQLDEWGSFVHTFNKLIPPEEYFEKHPEYFSLNGEHRLKDGQLCLSNPELIHTLKENLRKEIEIQPEKKYWSVSQNDCINFCECDGCNLLYKKYNSISGAYIFMANELAKEFPDKHISTLAYQFTRSAPENIRPLENVNIMFCSIECNRSMPLAEDSRSEDFVRDMENWSRLSKNIFLWDYVVQFKNYLTPFPNFHVLPANIQFFKENNVDMMFQQGSGGNWSDLSDLKQYFIAKLLWNPYENPDAIVKDFIETYYGPAESYIKSYYDLMHHALIENQETEFLNIYGFPSDYVYSYLTPSLLKKYKEFMDHAEESVKQDSVYLKRVLRTRLPVDFAYLDIALNQNYEDLSYLNRVGDRMSIRPDMLEYLNRFIHTSELVETTRINERNFTTEEYKAYVLRKLESMTRQNLAKDKTIELLTEPSDKYPVGGASALTDGLLGDLDFNHNWLGFEGNDMLVEINLLKPETIHQISMNFLKAVNSWIFLPEEVQIEVSEDGETYQNLGVLKGDITDKNYLVKSVPFNLKFNPMNVQYIRMKAISLKQCPEWHRGYGNPSWIFIDELIVE